MLNQESLYSRRRNDFIDFIKKSSIPNTVKSHFLNPSYFDNCDFPASYLYYSEMFSQLFFNGADYSDHVKKLNVAGYLFVRSIVAVDKVIDSKLVDDKGLLLSNICREESLKLLASLFPADSQFWSLWAKRREEYLNALSFDKNTGSWSFEDYEQLADNKSAFGKTAIDACHVLSGAKSKSVYNALIQSHRNFSVGFQILDDIQDFEEDLARNQKNVCHLLLFDQLKAKQIQHDHLDSKTLYKHFFIHGIAEELLRKADGYFNAALNDIQTHHNKLSLWIKTIQAKKHEVKLFLLQLKGYEKQLIARRFLSNELKVSVPFTQNDIHESITNAFDYVCGLQNDDGSWEDICLNSGLSNVWATGYIEHNLPCLENRYEAVHDEACNFLLKNHSSFLWGYNNEWIPDADSTTCVLLALAKNNHEISDYLPKWLGFQKSDGGFSTYNDSLNLNKYLSDNSLNNKGWLQSHPCVSALAYYFLSKYHRSSLHYKKLEEYLLTNLINAKTWRAYWWTSPIYSIVYALLGISTSKSKVYINYKKKIHSLLSMQKADGSFSDEYSAGNIFYTALVLKLLTRDAAIFTEFEKQAGKACEWLLKNQYSDGSFRSSTCLRVPSPAIVDPEVVKEWQRGYRKTNIVTEDFCRLFSTSQACNALFQYFEVTKYSHELSQ